MNANIKKLLTDLAEQAGLTLEFPNGEPVRISGFQDGDSPCFLINTDQPDSELIFNILEKIGLVPVQKTPITPPWFVNRPYENERIGEVAYKSRRAIRQKLNTEWRAGLWAMCAFVNLGCLVELDDYLDRHPKKWLLISLIMLAMLKTLVVKFISIPARLFRSLVNC